MTFALGAHRIDTTKLPEGLAFNSISYVDDRRVPRATDYNDRVDPILGILFHTIKGKRAPLKPGSKPCERDITMAQYQANTSREVSWDVTDGRDGDVVQSNDPTLRYTWHAGAKIVNRQTIGVEAVQDEDGTQYEATMTSQVRLAELLCERLHIPRVTPVNPDGSPFTGLLDDRVFRGAYGHRNVWKLNDAGKRTSMKPYGDPDDHIFKALLKAGFLGAIVEVRGGMGHLTGKFWERPDDPTRGTLIELATFGGAPVSVDSNALALPLTPPPWIDLSKRILLPAIPSRVTPEHQRDFVGRHYTTLTRVFNIAPAHAVALLAHTAVECAWGTAEVGHNAAGIKLRSTDDAVYRRKHGHGLGWYAKPGHIAAGDAAWVFYRAFESPEDFWSFWLKRYTPRSPDTYNPFNPLTGHTPEDKVQTADYTNTGFTFWKNPDPSKGAWLIEMILAGYRGTVRAIEMRDHLDRDVPLLHPSLVTYLRVYAQIQTILGAMHISR